MVDVTVVVVSEDGPVTVFREGAAVNAGVRLLVRGHWEAVAELDAYPGRLVHPLVRIGYVLDLATCMLQAGLARQESRGAHSRPSDFPDRDDEKFRKHSISEWVDGVPRLSYREVRVTKWEPTVRTY